MKVSAYTALTAPAANDLLVVVDVDDLTQAASGTTKSITVAALLGTAGVGMTLQAATPAAGYTLVNGTGAVISWSVPNDGSNHRFAIWANLHVATAETGGLIQVEYTGPWVGASTHFGQVFAAGLAADTTGQNPPGLWNTIVAPGSTVTIAQTSALTAGAATMWAEIWGS